MEELIRVNCDSGQPTVSGRELHEFLEVGTAYKDWFPRMCEYGFIEGEDYSSFLSDRSDGLPGKPRTDHQLTIAMAKEICMIQRNERGKQARQYFLALETAWNTPEQVMARALKMADEKIHSLVQQNAVLLPKAAFADAVSSSESCISVGELAKLLNQNGADTGEKRLFQQLRESGFLIRRLGNDFNIPTQRAMEMGLFRVKETTVSTDGKTYIYKTPKVTGKGQRYFLDRFLAGQEHFPMDSVRKEGQ